MTRNTKIQDCWIWNKTVSEFVNDIKEGYTLNVPCGKSNIGDVLADIDPQNDNIDKVDMRELPYNDNIFDTVIQDPPWKIGYYQRMKPFFECVRVVKLNGLIIYNAYWIPQSKFVDLERIFVRQDGQFTNTSVISVFRKTKKFP